MPPIKSERIQIRTTKSEKEKWESYANDLGLSLSEWLTQLANKEQSKMNFKERTGKPTLLKVVPKSIESMYGSEIFDFINADTGDFFCTVELRISSMANGSRFFIKDEKNHVHVEENFNFGVWDLRTKMDTLRSIMSGYRHVEVVNWNQLVSSARGTIEMGSISNLTKSFEHLGQSHKRDVLILLRQWYYEDNITPEAKEEIHSILQSNQELLYP